MSKVNVIENFYRLLWSRIKPSHRKMYFKMHDIPDKLFPIASSITICLIFYQLTGSFQFLKDVWNIIFIFFTVGFIYFLPVFYSMIPIAFDRHYPIREKVHILKIYILMFMTVKDLSLEEELEISGYLNIITKVEKPISGGFHDSIIELDKLVKKVFKKCSLNRQTNEFTKNNTSTGFFGLNYFLLAGLMATKEEKEHFVRMVEAYQNEKLFETDLLRNESSFKSFFYQRIKINDKIDLGFLLFCFLIPKQKEISLDSYKQILGTCRISKGSVESNSNIRVTIADNHGPFNQYAKLFSRRDKIITAFDNYSESDLKRIFTTNHTENDLLDVYEEIIKTKKEIKLPILKNFQSILHYVKNYTNTYDTPRNKELIESIQEDGFSFKYVLNYEQLGNLAIILENCLKTRHERIVSGYSNIIEIYKENEIYGALEFNDREVIEIKGKNNKKIEDRKIILEILYKNKIIL